MANKGEETVGFRSFRMRVFLNYGNQACLPVGRGGGGVNQMYYIMDRFIRFELRDIPWD